MQRILFVMSFFCFFASVSAQTVIQITEDKVYEETLVIDENTILEGIGAPKITFNGSPKILVKSSSFLMKNIRLTNKSKLIQLDGDDSFAEWYGVGMTGYMTNMTDYDHTIRLDGSSRD